jgi:DNA repair exonuclease SbcCD ATPase subunit
MAPASRRRERSQICRRNDYGHDHRRATPRYWASRGRSRSVYRSSLHGLRFDNDLQELKDQKAHLKDDRAVAKTKLAERNGLRYGNEGLQELKDQQEQLNANLCALKKRLAESKAMVEDLRSQKCILEKRNNENANKLNEYRNHCFDLKKDHDDKLLTLQNELSVVNKQRQRLRDRTMRDVHPTVCFVVMCIYYVCQSRCIIMLVQC